MSRFDRHSGLALSAILLIMAGLVGAGYFAGHWMALRPLKMRIRANAAGETLGPLLGEGKKRTAAASVYDDGKKALRELDGYSWSVPVVLTPFVGNGPAPGRHANAQIDARQMRDERELRLPKPAGVFRIFLTGGSTAYSSGAPRQDRTIAAYLESILRESAADGGKYEVFTMATPAWSSTHERIAIEDRLSDWEPDLIVSLSGANDVYWGGLGRNVLWFRSHADEFFWDLMNTSYQQAGFERMPDPVEVQKGPVSPELVAERLERNVKLSRYALSMKRVPYVFALQPTSLVGRKQLTPRERAILRVDTKDYFAACYAAMRERLQHVDEEGFHFVDLSGAFDDKRGDEEIFLDSFHFGDRGNRYIAEALYRGLAPILAR